MSITVNGETVQPVLIENERDSLRERYGPPPDGVGLKAHEERIEADARENAIERLLLIQEARRAPLEIRPDEVESRMHALLEEHGGKQAFLRRTGFSEADLERLRADFADGLRLERYMESICRHVPPPTEEECLAYYREHGEEFGVPERIHASHIVCRPRPGEPPHALHAALLNLRERLAKGADFAEAARRHSDCGDEGGDLGWFAKGQMTDAFEREVFALGPGETSPVFATEFGLHIARVHAREKARIRPFHEVRKTIAGLLHDQRKNEAIGLVVDGLREKASIVEEPDAPAAPAPPPSA